MKQFETQPNVTVLALERERDQLADRITRISREPAGPFVEAFEYVARDGVSGEERAKKIRGRLMCSMLRRIDAINTEICRRIHPGFEPTPDEGFTDRVMSRVRGMPVSRSA